MPESDNSFRKSVKRMLKKYGISQNGLAACCGKSSGSLSQILKEDDSSLHLETKRAILKGFLEILSERNLSPYPIDKKEPLFFEDYSVSCVGTHFNNEQRRRKDFDAEIEDNILTAQKCIIFFGGISKDKMNSQWYHMLGAKLAETKELEIFFFIEALQNLFWRSLSLTNDSDDSRQYSELKEKHERQIDIKISISERLRSSIERSFDNDSYNDVYDENKNNIIKNTLEDVSNRIHVYEVDVPIYTFYLKIDDIIYITPRNNLRASNSFTMMVDNQNDLRWQQSNRCIEMFLKLAKEKKFVSSPRSEKILVFPDGSATPVGSISRSTFDRVTTLKTRVAHGLIFNREGELLIHRRDEKAYDCINLWDKSFGGNLDPENDWSLRETADRELREEVLGEMIFKLNNIISDKKILDIDLFEEYQKTIDCGRWRDSSGLESIKKDDDNWHFFLLKEHEKFPSVRQIMDGLITREIYADIYIFICNEHFTDFTKKILGRIEESHNIFEWINVSDIDDIIYSRSKIKAYPRTPDLDKYFDEPYKTELTKISTFINKYKQKVALT